MAVYRDALIILVIFSTNSGKRVKSVMTLLLLLLLLVLLLVLLSNQKGMWKLCFPHHP